MSLRNALNVTGNCLAGMVYSTKSSHEDSPIKSGDRCTVLGHSKGWVARVLAVAEGYAMVRYSHAAPFVVPIEMLRPIS
jgi:hypothetical protein